MDFEVALLALDCHMNKRKTDKLINLIYRAAHGLDAFTLKDHQEIQNTWDLAAERLTKVCFINPSKTDIDILTVSKDRSRSPLL